MLVRILICLALLAIPSTGLAQCFGGTTFVQAPGFTVVQSPAFFAPSPFVQVRAPFTAIDIGSRVSVAAPGTFIDVGPSFSTGGRVFVRRGLFGRRSVDVRF